MTNNIPDLIHALLNPGAYPHSVENCSLIETHISWVILTGNYAYKIKKPINLGFLDFSTLDKRLHCCNEELRLNRRLAPEVYIDVIPIGGTLQNPQLDTLPAIEYAVKMRQFPQNTQLDRILASGQLTKSHIDTFAHAIARFHQQIRIADEHSPYGELAHVYKPIVDTIDSFRAQLLEEQHKLKLEGLAGWVESTFKRLELVFLTRKKSGFIRECHGDMHLRNLAWVNEKPLIFDCIEFNDNLLWNDVISEIAFLVMDLDDRKQTALAQRFLNAYLEHTGDYSGLQVLTFYLVYRALVRGMVAAIRMNQSDVSTDDKNKAHKDVTDYLDLAQGYTREKLRFLCIARGMSGSGKTTITQDILMQLGAIRIRSDVERKRLHGIPPLQNSSTSVESGIYSAAATKKTYDKLLQLAKVIVEAGFPVIVDATFQTYDQRRVFEKLSDSLRTPCAILEFVAKNETLMQRITTRTNDASDANIEVLKHQLENWQPLEKIEQKLLISINTEEDINIDELSQKIQSSLQSQK